MFFETLKYGPLAVNTYILAGDDHIAAVIDPANANRIIEILQQNQLTLTHILLTHGHFDHISAVKQLKEKTGAAVAIHENDADKLTSPVKSYGELLGFLVNQCPPDEFLREGPYAAGGLNFTVIHTPGHSAGGVCLLLGDMLFSGDTLFYRDVGRYDFPDSSGKDLKRSIERLLELPDNVKVFPGHMRPTTIGEEREAGVVMRYLDGN